MEFDIEPDRLTPPATPEPEAAPAEGEEGQGEEMDEQDEDDMYRQDDEDIAYAPDDRYAHDIAYDDQAPVQEPLFLNSEGEEDEDTLAAAGLVVADQIEGDEENAELEFDEDGNYNFDIATFRANRDAQRRQIMEGNRDREVEEEDNETRLINSTSFAKGDKWKRSDKWTPVETDFFYAVGAVILPVNGTNTQVLGEVGENYSMMKAWFPGRTIAQIKRKGLKENRDNPDKVTRAILDRRPLGTWMHLQGIYWLIE